MPLIKSSSKQAFKSNLEKEMKAGKPQNQALAIAYATKKRAKKMAQGGIVGRSTMVNEEQNPQHEAPRDPRQMQELDAMHRSNEQTADGKLGGDRPISRDEEQSTLSAQEHARGDNQSGSDMHSDELESYLMGTDKRGPIADRDLPKMHREMASPGDDQSEMARLANGGMVHEDMMNDHDSIMIDDDEDEDQSEDGKYAHGGQVRPSMSVVDQIMASRDNDYNDSKVQSHSDVMDAESEVGPDVDIDEDQRSDLEPVHYAKDSAHDLDEDSSRDDQEIISQILRDRRNKRRGM